MSETPDMEVEMGLPKLGEAGKQPSRGDGDGRVGLQVDQRRGLLVLTSEQNGAVTELLVSPFNAWRIFGMLALTLGIKLPPKLGKAIKLQ